jgi:hypothetical protein
VENYDILLDTLWKVSEWQNLKDTVLPKAQVEESPKFRMVQAYAALNDKEWSWHSINGGSFLRWLCNLTSLFLSSFSSLLNFRSQPVFFWRLAMGTKLHHKAQDSLLGSR